MSELDFDKYKDIEIKELEDLKLQQICIASNILKDKEIERLNNELELQNIEMGREIERLQDMDKILRNENINLKLRIDKAIEYINSDEMLKLREEFEYCNDKDLFDDFAGHLDRILRGSDKE